METKKQILVLIMTALFFISIASAQVSIGEVSTGAVIIGGPSIFIDTNATTGCSGSQVLFGNGSCGVINGGGDTDTWWTVNFDWLFNDSGNLDFNETKFNTSTSIIANLSIRNIFDQVLNTTSNVTFEQVNITERLFVNGSVEIDHQASEDNDHGIDLEIDIGTHGGGVGLFIDFIVGAITAEQDEEAILININQFAALGGDIEGIEILTTEGGARVIGMEVGVQIDPIVHESGIFADMDSALNNGTDARADFINDAVNTSIFVADGDTVTIGNAIRFEEMEFILSTVASGAGIRSVFYHSTGIGTWAEFSPADGTNNMRNTGAILWLDEDIPSWAEGTGSEFLIRINRTRVNLATTPVAQKIQISSAIEYIWDKNGYLNINNITANNGSFSNRVGIGNEDPQNDLDIRNVNGANLSLTRIDDAVVGDDLIGQILWLSNDSTNTDSKVAGYIRLLADTNWGGANPEGMIEFGTSTSGTPVTTHMTIDKTGEVTLTQDLMVDGGNIGLTIDPNLLTLANESITIRGTYSVVSPGTATNIFDISSSVGVTLMNMRETGTSQGIFAMRDSTDTVVLNFDTTPSIDSWINIGDIGIGTISPSHLLNVAGDTNITADLYIQDDLFVFDQVGVGTTTPDEALDVHIDQSGVTRIRLANQDTSATAIAAYRIQTSKTDFQLLSYGPANAGTRYGINRANFSDILANTGLGLFIGTGSDDEPIYFGNNDLVRMTIDAGGNIGIRTSSPQFELDVNGEINATTYNARGSAGFTGTCLSSEDVVVVGGIVTACI